MRTQQKLRIEAEAALAALAAAVAADARAAAADAEASRCAAALAVAEAQAEALRVDRSEGRVKLQARWGARGSHPKDYRHGERNSPGSGKRADAPHILTPAAASFEVGVSTPACPRSKVGGASDHAERVGQAS